MTYRFSCRRVATVISIVTVAVLFCSTFAAAQDQPTPKWEVFAGYSYFDACSNLRAVRPGATLPVTVCLTPNKVGVGTSLTYNLNRWFGLTGDFSGHWHADAGASGLQASRFYNVSVGPKFTLRRDHFAPFIEALVGWHRLSTDTFGSSDDVGFITGGGIDIPLTKHFGLRLAQADYVMSNHRFGTVGTTPLTRVRGFRVQTGLKFMFGGEEAVAPVSASCSVQPTEVMAGEPVQASVNASNFRPNHKLSYNWTSTGGQVSGQESTTTIATNGLAGGNYVVTARVSDPKMKKGGEASCSSNFTVRVPEPTKNPPTLSCSATPTTVRAGDASTVTVTAGNPDNRQLTYNYTTSAGRVSGNGTSATLDTAGANAGPITVTATVSDDRGMTANCTASVNVEVPPPPPQASQLNSCQFNIDQKRPSRVDNTCKAILDEVALRLQRESDSKLVIVGHADAAMDKNKAAAYAAQRAVNSKLYLSGGEAKQQIDPSRIEVRTGAETGQTADYWLVPAGASFNAEGTQSVDENAVQAPAKKAPARTKR